MKKYLAALTASVMALGSLSALGVQAEEIALPGDVDGDGYITGHDSALLCRSLREENFSLTEEELARADATGDGLVNREDLDWIRANEEYQIGDVDLNGILQLADAYDVCMLTEPGSNIHLNTLQYNLADYTADREVYSEDARALVEKESLIAVHEMNDSLEHHVEKGTYYSFDLKIGDFDGDGYITYHDVALMQCAVAISKGDIFFLRDTNRDGYIDDKDFAHLKTMIEYNDPFGHCDGKSCSEAFRSSYDALMISSYESTKMLEIINQSEANALKQNGQSCVWDESRQRYVIGLTDYKLYDVTLDGKVDIKDATSLLEGSNRLAMGKRFFLEDSYYEYKLYPEKEESLDLIEFPD